MTDKIQQARRELFENYVQYRQYLKRNKDGSYNEEWVDARWQGFNAALDCVVIELPADRAKRPVFMHETLEDSAHNNCRELCAVAIESTNLGLRIK